jgi:hypothetical protein
MIAKNGAPETERHHIGGMAKYNIYPGEDSVGFEISVISDNGAKQTMLGFKTFAEADAWVTEDMRLNYPRQRQIGAGLAVSGRSLMSVERQPSRLLDSQQAASAHQLQTSK